MYTHLQREAQEHPPITLTTLARLKQQGEKIACLTAYDASFAALLDQAGVELVLVGDSLGMVIQGHDSTVPVTMDDVLYHTRAVARGLHRAFLVALQGTTNDVAALHAWATRDLAEDARQLTSITRFIPSRLGVSPSCPT